MIFRSDTCTVLGINKTTKAKGFKDVSIGDILKFNIDLEDTDRGPNGLYALIVSITHYKVENNCITNRNHWTNSQKQFINNIKNFEFKKDRE